MAFSVFAVRTLESSESVDCPYYERSGENVRTI